MPVRPDPGVVSLRQSLDQVVTARPLRHRDDHRIVLRAEARDVLRHRAVEQLDVLRQVTDVLPERLRVPVPKIRAVDPHRAVGDGPDARDGPDQGRFARRARTDHPHDAAGLQPEAHAMQDGGRRAGGRDHQAVDLDQAARARQREARRLVPDARHHLRQAGVAGAGGREALPVADDRLDRRERPAQDDRGRDHRTGRDLAADGEVGPEAEDHRLQEHAGELRRRRDEAGAVARARLQQDRLVVASVPARAQGGEHAHRPQNLTVPEGRARLLAGLAGDLARRVERSPRGDLGQEGQSEERAAAEERHPAEPGVQDEAGDQEQQGPGQVAEGEERAARQELAQAVDVPQARLVAGPWPQQSGPVHDLEGGAGDLPIEDHAGPHQEARPEHLEGGVDRQREGGDRRDADKRRLVPAQEHAVVNLQHVQGADEEQQVREEGEDQNRHENGPDRAQPILQDGPDRRLAHDASPPAGPVGGTESSSRIARDRLIAPCDQIPRIPLASVVRARHALSVILARTNCIPS